MAAALWLSESMVPRLSGSMSRNVPDVLKVCFGLFILTLAGNYCSKAGLAPALGFGSDFYVL